MKYILVPISTLGCGKSTTFRILTSLYPKWVHIENDNCSSKRQFYTNIETSLATADVILLDRNNHLVKQREEIVANFKGPEVQLIALIFVDSSVSPEKLWSTTFNRIKSRGDNHQSIQSTSQAGLTKMVMNKFIKQFEPFDTNNEGDKQYVALHMSLSLDSSKENAETILQFLHKEAPDLVPEVAPRLEIDALYEQAIQHKVPEEAKQANRGNGQRGGRGSKRGGRGTGRGGRGTGRGNSQNGRGNSAQRGRGQVQLAPVLVPEVADRV